MVISQINTTGRCDSLCSWRVSSSVRTTNWCKHYRLTQPPAVWHGYDKANPGASHFEKMKAPSGDSLYSHGNLTAPIWFRSSQSFIFGPWFVNYNAGSSADVSSITKTQSLPLPADGGTNVLKPWFSNSPMAVVFPSRGSNQVALTRLPVILFITMVTGWPTERYETRKEPFKATAALM
jgi:hypothetical protein